MKKIFTLLCITIAFFSQQAAAQLKKGEKMLGGNIGFTNLDTEQDRNPGYKAESSNILVQPQLGFGIGGNWIIGIQAGFAYNKQETSYPFQGTQEQKSRTISGGVFARKFFPVGERFGIFGQGDVSYARSKDKYTTQGGSNGEINGNSIMVAVSPGAYFRTGKRFILEAEVGSLGYEHRTSKPESGGDKVTSNSVFLGLSNNLSIGFKVVL
jgi:hypothetical protein